MKTYNEIKQEVRRELDKEELNVTICITTIIIASLLLTLIPII